MRSRWLVALVLWTGCGVREARAGHGARTEAPRGDECTIDSDCVLMPEVTCCGECPPAPPFEAAPRESLDAVLIEAEERCATDLRPCTPPVCDPVPRGCWAKAACDDGRCVAATDGCVIAGADRTPRR
jgi:hypothetical protein